MVNTVLIIIVVILIILAIAGITIFIVATTRKTTTTGGGGGGGTPTPAPTTTPAPSSTPVPSTTPAPSTTPTPTPSPSPGLVDPSKTYYLFGFYNSNTLPNPNLSNPVTASVTQSAGPMTRGTVTSTLGFTSVTAGQGSNLFLPSNSTNASFCVTNLYQQWRFVPGPTPGQYAIFDPTAGQYLGSYSNSAWNFVGSSTASPPIQPYSPIPAGATYFTVVSVNGYTNLLAFLVINEGYLNLSSSNSTIVDIDSHQNIGKTDSWILWDTSQGSPPHPVNCKT